MSQQATFELEKILNIWSLKAQNLWDTHLTKTEKKITRFVTLAFLIPNSFFSLSLFLRRKCVRTRKTNKNCRPAPPLHIVETKRIEK